VSASENTEGKWAPVTKEDFGAGWGLSKINNLLPELLKVIYHNGTSQGSQLELGPTSNQLRGLNNVSTSKHRKGSSTSYFCAR